MMETKEAIRGMSNEQLVDLHEALHVETARRDRIAKEQDWAEVQNAIVNFTSKWGSISVIGEERTIDITKSEDFNTIGEIDTTNW